MPTVDVMDETFVVAPPATLKEAISDPASWALWWPDLVLTVFADRGDEGIRWTVSGEWTGSQEIWLEAVGDGTVLHYFLRIDPTAPGGPHARLSGRAAARVSLARQTASKRIAFMLKDHLEGDRPPGVPPSPTSSSTEVSPPTPKPVTHVAHPAEQGTRG